MFLSTRSLSLVFILLPSCSLASYIADQQAAEEAKIARAEEVKAAENYYENKRLEERKQAAADLKQGEENEKNRIAMTARLEARANLINQERDHASTLALAIKVTQKSTPLQIIGKFVKLEGRLTRSTDKFSYIDSFGESGISFRIKQPASVALSALDYVHVYGTVIPGDGKELIIGNPEFVLATRDEAILLGALPTSNPPEPPMRNR